MVEAKDSVTYFREALSGMFDALIIGGGPAGCTCAAWLQMLGRTPVLVEARTTLGGLQIDSPYANRWIPFLGGGWTGQRVAEGFDDFAREQAICTQTNCEVTNVAPGADGFETTTSAGKLRSRIVVVASGVRAVTGGLPAGPRLLIGPGKKIASTDFSGKSVAILGGGDNAFENYSFIREAGASVVKIHARNVRARAALVAQVPREDVERGRYVVHPGDNTVNGRPFDFIVVLYGWAAHLPFLESLNVSRMASGFLHTDSDCESSQEGLFAIGEVAKRAHPCCITAMADGVVAAKAIQLRLERRHALVESDRVIHPGLPISSKS
jgi:thioredoxin reductase (NADPH)